MYGNRREEAFAYLRREQAKDRKAESLARQSRSHWFKARQRRTTGGNTKLSDLPRVLLGRVLEHLAVGELLVASVVCKATKLAVLEPCVWQTVCLQDMQDNERVYEWLQAAHAFPCLNHTRVLQMGSPQRLTSLRLHSANRMHTVDASQCYWLKQLCLTFPALRLLRLPPGGLQELRLDCATLQSLGITGALATKCGTEEALKMGVASSVDQGALDREWWECMQRLELRMPLLQQVCWSWLYSATFSCPPVN
jgi:hypothetical protein